jgi:hypothetical protein
MQTENRVTVVLYVLALAAFVAAGVLISSLAHAAPLEPVRFGVSDGTTLRDGLTTWLLHDARHPERCALVMDHAGALTSQPWPCS